MTSAFGDRRSPENDSLATVRVRVRRKIRHVSRKNLTAFGNTDSTEMPHLLTVRDLQSLKEWHSKVFVASSRTSETVGTWSDDWLRVQISVSADLHQMSKFNPWTTYIGWIRPSAQGSPSGRYQRIDVKAYATVGFHSLHRVKLSGKS